MTYLDLVRIAWHRKPLFALGIVVALVIGAIYYARATPIYESSAEVLVVKKRPEVVTGDQIYAARATDDYLSTHAVVVKSPIIVQSAIDKGGLARLTTFTNEKFRDPRVDLTTAITDQLDIGLGSKEMGRGAHNILTVSFRGPIPSECAHTVKAILGSYQDFLDETYRNMGEDTIELIGHARDDLQQDLQTQEEDYRGFRQASPLITTGSTEFNPRQDRLTAIEGQLSELLLRETNFEAQLENIRAAKASGRKGDELIALVSSLSNRVDKVYDNRNSNTNLDTELFTLLQEEQKLLQNLDRITLTSNLCADELKAHAVFSHCLIRPIDLPWTMESCHRIPSNCMSITLSKSWQVFRLARNC
jgi:uncharacterized protein involved in exopolysaccharide biosynthesis